MNAVSDTFLDKLIWANKRTIPSRKGLTVIKENLKLVNAWRHLHPKKRDWTYAQFAKEEPRPYRQAARLDTFLVREGLVNRIIKCEIMKSEHTGSDHRAVQIEYKLDRIQLAGRECYQASPSENTKTKREAENRMPIHLDI
jgi:hypothetical protein